MFSAKPDNSTPNCIKYIYSDILINCPKQNHNNQLLLKINSSEEFLKACHVGDIFILGDISTRITSIQQNMIYGYYLDYLGRNKNMGINVYIHYLFTDPKFYKYIGPKTEEIQNKQNITNHLNDLFVELRLEPINNGGNISFIGEDFREGRDKFYTLIN